MPSEVALVWNLTRATLAHHAAADEYREPIVKRRGRRALVSVAFAITAARIYPTVNGHAVGRSAGVDAAARERRARRDGRRRQGGGGVERARRRRSRGAVPGWRHADFTLRLASINGLPGIIVDGPEGPVQTAAFEKSTGT
jgi:hypothetical protein